MSEGSHGSGLPKSTVMVAAIAISFAGIGTFMVLKWTGSRAKTAELGTLIADISVEEEALSKELTSLQTQYEDIKGRTDALASGLFAICNVGTETLTIVRLAATYPDGAGGFTTFSTEEFGDNLWKVSPNEKKSLTFPQAPWDGSVTYYALWFEAGGEEYPSAGMWPIGKECIPLSG